MSLDSFYSQLMQLEKDGYVTLVWEPFVNERMNDGLQLAQAMLTVSGHKLLQELREKSAPGRVKKRVVDLVWIVLTSIATTLAVLWVRG